MFKTRVSVEDLSEIIVDRKIQCRFTRNDGLDYSEIEVLWSFDNNCMQRLGLHGGYWSDYQYFSFINGNLVIDTDDLITITVYCLYGHIPAYDENKQYVSVNDKNHGYVFLYRIC